MYELKSSSSIIQRIPVMAVSMCVEDTTVAVRIQPQLAAPGNNITGRMNVNNE